MNILLVKLSSLGDVLHNLPVVWDLRVRYPDARIDWVVEEGYLQLLEPMRALDDGPGIDDIIAVSLRRWRRTLANGQWSSTRSEWRAFRQQLSARRYDVIIDTQGLIKSAIVARLAPRTADGVIAGLANRTEFSGYEPLARLLYTQRVTVPYRCHAVDRSRAVAAAAVGAMPPARASSPPRFYPRRFVESLGRNPLMTQPYALCLHCTARKAKRWASAHWIELGRLLRDRGLVPVYPWGSAAERTISESIAAEVPGAVVPAAFSMRQAFHVVAGARLVAGVDTGLTHLAAILGRPTLELYCDSPRWKTEGYWSSSIRNLGDRGAPPSPHAAIGAILALL
jgi:heptosyltransferase-1